MKAGGWILGALIVTALVGFVLFPVVARPNRGPRVRLVDANWQPVREATVTLIDGGRTKQISTGKSGGFDCDEPTARRIGVQGYELARIMRSSGSATRYYFAPAGTVTVRLVDAQGKEIRQPKATLNLLDYRLGTYRPVPFVNGVCRLEHAPLSLNVNDMELAREPGWRSITTRRVVKGDEVAIEYVLRPEKAAS